MLAQVRRRFDPVAWWNSVLCLVLWFVNVRCKSVLNHLCKLLSHTHKSHLTYSTRDDASFRLIRSKSEPEHLFRVSLPVVGYYLKLSENYLIFTTG
jgi:hypothetical protein